MEIALPDPDNASRVIITTRSLDVAKATDCNTKPYMLHYLSDTEGLAVLFRNTFQQDVQPENYPHLLEVTKRLTKKCGGLPLALVVLGGILRRRDCTNIAWSEVEETMDWHNEEGEKGMKILAKSYEDLPYHLKQCFLYFAAFPEDYQISGKHVTRMWIAEGFIPEDGARTMEDKAEAYLEELAQRYLIQVTEKYWNGDCKMHDLLRDLAIHEAKEKNFFTLFSNSQDVNQLAARNPCCVALQFCTPMRDANSETTRSLLCFGLYSWKYSWYDKPNFSGFRLLRVLTIERVYVFGTEWLKDLKHLRYLGFRYCNNLGNIALLFFNNLETIDLKGSGGYRYCSDVVIPTLRHIYGPDIRFALKWDQLTNLQTLKSVGQEEVPRLGCSTKNLRTLGIYYGRHTDRDEEWETLKGVLTRTTKLVSLSIKTGIDEIWNRFYCVLLPFGNGGTRGLPCHEMIQSLLLHGRWTNLEHSRTTLLPSVEMFPTNLTKLTLHISGLEEDPMPIFEKLQNLRILRLRIGSYVGTKLICSTGVFLKLEKLELRQLRQLTHWDINEGAMPILSHLEIDGCLNLLALPELQKVQSLQELLVENTSPELLLRTQKQDVYKIEHIPFVRITRSALMRG